MGKQTARKASTMHRVTFESVLALALKTHHHPLAGLRHYFPRCTAESRRKEHMAGVPISEGTCALLHNYIRLLFGEGKLGANCHCGS